MAPEKASPEVVTRGRKNLDCLFYKVGITDFKGKEEISLKRRKKKKKPEGNCPPPSPTGLNAGTNKQEDGCAQ